MLFFLCSILYLTFYRCRCCRYCSDIVNNDNYIPVDNAHTYTNKKGNNITENRRKRTNWNNANIFYSN